MTIVCLSLALPAALMSFGVCAWLVGPGRRLAHLDVPGRETHKGHHRPVPTTGGIAIFLAILVPIVTALAAVWLVPAQSWGGWLAPLVQHLPGIRTQSSMAAAVLVALAIFHVVGLADDRRPLRTATKLGIELVVAAVLAGAFELRIFQILQHERFGIAGVVLCVVLSALWLVGITNALNMLDNMDGLAGGVAAIVATLYLVATLIGQQWFVAALCALVLGASIGFLVFNFPPARLFMGDGGSLVLGLLLAVISVRTTYFGTDTAGVPGAWFGVLMPLVVMAVPLYDLMSVTMIRLRAGRSPFAADQNHLSHRLVRQGLSRRGAVLTIWLATLATGLGGVLLSRLSGWQAAVVAVHTVAVLALLAALEMQR